MSARLERNILVISDLHLGDDLRPTAASVSRLRQLATLERELVAFLTHYTTHRLDGRAWRLVVNGDMVDFMSIQIMPDAAAGAFPVSDDERRYGLGHGEEQSQVKLERVLGRHPEIFRTLARFVAAGNEVELVAGNHDVEFHFESLQRRFVAAMVELGAPGAAIHFRPWFYYEADVVYVEHGHQYDEYCSFDYQLQPVVAERGVACTMSHAGVRYFTNLIPQMDPHDAEGWHFLDYLRWMHALGVRGAARVLFAYAGLIRQMIDIWASLTDRASDAARAKVHQARLFALASSQRIAVGKVELLDGLRRLPVLKSFPRLLITMFLDRLLLWLGVALAFGLTVGLSHGWWKLGSSLGVLAGGVAVNYGLSRLRLLDSVQLLRRAPEAIRRVIQAPFIVFGHSHHAEAVALAGGGTYFNTGSWLGSEKTWPFTHLIISGEGDATAELCQWRDGASIPLGSWRHGESGSRVRL